MSTLQQLALKQPDSIADRVLKLKQAWDDRLQFPFSGLPERYLWKKLHVLLKFSCDFEGDQKKFIVRIELCGLDEMRRDAKA